MPTGDDNWPLDEEKPQSFPLIFVRVRPAAKKLGFLIFSSDPDASSATVDRRRRWGREGKTGSGEILRQIMNAEPSRRCKQKLRGDLLSQSFPSDFRREEKNSLGKTGEFSHSKIM